MQMLRAALARYGLPRAGSKAVAWANLRSHYQPLCPVAPRDRQYLRTDFRYCAAADGYLVADANVADLPATQASCLRTYGDICGWQLATAAVVTDREQRRLRLNAIVQQRPVHCKPYNDYVLWGIGDPEDVATRVGEEWFFTTLHGPAFYRYRHRLSLERHTPSHLLDALAREHVCWMLALKYGPRALAQHRTVPAALRARLLRGDFDIWPGGRRVQCDTVAPQGFNVTDRSI
jgi:hypothetical protein